MSNTENNPKNHTEPTDNALVNYGPSEEDKKVHPIDRANCFSYLFHSWINQCLTISSKHPWQQEYHYELSENDKVEINEVIFEQAFNKSKKILPAIFYAWKKHFIIILIICLVSVILQ